MTRNRFLHRSLLGAVTILAAGLAACSDMGGMDHGSGTPTASIPASAGFNTADVTFAQDMIVHHGQAVTMAELAETRAQDPELKALAAKIKSAQAPEIATMTGWLQTWAQPSTKPGGHAGMDMGMPGMMSDADMKALEGLSGKEFDKKFATMMIAHHQGAITMAKTEQATGSSTQAKQLAATIEKDQTAEIATLQAMVNRLQ